MLFVVTMGLQFTWDKLTGQVIHRCKCQPRRGHMHLFPSVSPPLVHDGQPAARILWSQACTAPSIHQRGQQDRSWGNVAIYDEINVTITTFSVNSNRQMYYSEHQNNVFLPDYKGSVLLNAFYIRKRVRREVRNYCEIRSDQKLF